MPRTFHPRSILALAAGATLFWGCSDNASQITGTQLAAAAVRASRSAPDSQGSTRSSRTRLVLAPDKLSLGIAKSATISPELVNSDGDTTAVTLGVRWSTGDTTVAQVSRDGVVTAARSGSTKVTASWHGATASATLTVSAPTSTSTTVTTTSTAASVSISPSSVTLDVGQEGRLSVSVTDGAGNPMSGVPVTWSSSDPGVATVSGGLVTAVSAGEAVIKSTADGVSGTATVTVNAPPTSAPTSSGSTSILTRALVSDDFAGYTSDAGLLSAYTVEYAPELVHLDTQVRYAGHPTMRYDQPGGSSATPQVHVALPQTLTNLWYRAKIRFSPGWSTKGSRPPSETAEAYKLFGIGWAGYDGRFTFDYTNTSQYETSINIKNRATGAFPILVYGTAGMVHNEWTDGGWYDFIVHLWQPTPTSYRAEMWIAADGQVPQLRGTLAGTMNNGEPAPGMNRIMLGLNFNDTRYPDQSQSLWYGEWQVIDGLAHPNPFNLP